jgi:hypothetical protein
MLQVKSTTRGEEIARVSFSVLTLVSALERLVYMHVPDKLQTDTTQAIANNWLFCLFKSFKLVHLACATYHADALNLSGPYSFLLKSPNAVSVGGTRDAQSNTQCTACLFLC